VYRNEKLSLQSYQDVIAPHAVQCVEKARFSDRHFWHAGYDKASWRAYASVCDRKDEHPLYVPNIRFMFQAMVTRLHSPRTLSSPRSRNWRNPSADLMMPNTGSGVCLRKP